MTVDQLNRSKFTWKELSLHYGRRKTPVLALVVDIDHHHLFRIRYPDGWESSPANLSRAKDAAFGHARYLLGAESPSEAPQSGIMDLEARMTGKRKRRPAPRFLQLHHRLLKSHAWHVLTPLQRCGYIEIAQLYDSTNNGRLAMSVRRLAGLIPCNKDSNILNELEDAGLIETVKQGRYAKKLEERAAAEYRLTDFRCDVTGEVPSRRYNPKHLWEPGQAKPKRKPLSVAERVRRYRKKRCNGCNTDRPVQSDGNVPVSGTDFVTSLKPGATGSCKTAKNDSLADADVTPTVPPSHTHIHLTMGGASLEGTSVTPLVTRSEREKHAKSRVQNKNGHFGVSSVTPLKALAPGHSTCKHPTVSGLPSGWHYCRFEKAVVTDTGVIVPLVDDPLVGTEEQRDAHRFLRRWVRPSSQEAAA